MSGAMREKDEADFDLERFTEMFDRAMTSSDPRVKNALRQLMMMVILTDEGDHEAYMRAGPGPLRRMQEDMREQFKWIRRLEQEIHQLKQQVLMNQTFKQTEAQSRGWPKDFEHPYYGPNNTFGQAVDPKEYQAALQSGVNLSQSALRDISVKINSGLLPKEGE